ncbi:MAG: 4Fe-4S binding protein [Desulfarculus sp.]|nr:4Fe-4S binding protein [Desulfarculus sp.]
MGQVSWDSAAAAALGKVPFLVRPLARRKVEDRVAAQGRQRVLLSDFAEAEARFRAVMGGRSEKELQGLLPQDNRPGAGLTVLEACRSELSGCPNRLIDVEAWRQALQEWLDRDQVSERLRARVSDPQVLYHHKLRLAVAGCPNGCSRPQIADLALVGFVRPEFYLDHCQGCGACARDCPDQAIVMVEDRPVWDQAACQGCLACSKACPTECIITSQPAARLLMGGKLGRHPHLAQAVGEASDPAQAVEDFKAVVENYLNTANPGERFAAWWTRTH